MASSGHLTRLKNIRDNLEKVVEDELARVAVLTAAGHPPPATYDSGGKKVNWNEWYATMMVQVKELNAFIVAAGADEGGIPEASTRLF